MTVLVFRFCPISSIVFCSISNENGQMLQILPVFKLLTRLTSSKMLFLIFRFYFLCLIVSQKILAAAWPSGLESRFYGDS